MWLLEFIFFPPISLCYFHVSSETIGLSFHITSSLGNPQVALFLRKQLHYTRCSNNHVHVCLSLFVIIMTIYYCFLRAYFSHSLNNVSIKYNLQKDPTLCVMLFLWNINLSACCGTLCVCTYVCRTRCVVSLVFIESSYALCIVCMYVW